MKVIVKAVELWPSGPALTALRTPVRFYIGLARSDNVWYRQRDEQQHYVDGAHSGSPQQVIAETLKVLYDC